MFRRIFQIIIVFYFLAGSAINAQRDQLFVGTRPFSMGEAFVAVADDGNTISWNPAGLGRMERIQATFNYADLFGLGIKNIHASFISRLYFVPSLTDYLAFGADWSRIEFGDEELNFGRNHINFSLAFTPPQNWTIIRDVYVGANVKYLDMNANLVDNKSGINPDVNGFGWDLGLLYNLSRLPLIPSGLDLGIMIYDVGGTTVTHKEIMQGSSSKEELLSQNIRWGFSYRPFEKWTGGNFAVTDPVLALDFDDRVHFGLEFWLQGILAVRAGIQKDLHTDEKPAFSFGLGFRMKSKAHQEVLVDYAFTAPPDLPNTSRQFGGSLIVKVDPRLVRIEGSNSEDLYASLFLHYGRPDSHIGSLKMKNISQDTLKSWISYDESEYIHSQVQDTIYIAPGEPLNVALRPVFKPGLFDAARGHVSTKVKVNYEYKENDYFTAAPIVFEVYDKNFLTWDDPEKSAAFVTVNDEIVRAFRSHALSRKDNIIKDQHWFFNYNMSSALMIYHALQAYDVVYQIDEKYPFTSRKDYPLDKISYPSEILQEGDPAKRFGDCDDLSVLYAALLQNAGISTVIVSQPAHLFMMFDTGIPRTQRRGLPVSPELFYPYKETLWMPVDVALITNKSFVDAWESGIERLSTGDIETYFEVAAAQRKYPAPTLAQSQDWNFVIPENAGKLTADLDKIDALTDQFFSTFEDSLARNMPVVDKRHLRNQYGILLSQNNRTDNAKEQFEIILKEDSANAPAWNNLGNTDFIIGNFSKAESSYLNALKYSLANHGIYINLAILYQMMIDGASPERAAYYQERSENAIENAAALFAADEMLAFTYLGYPKETIEGKAEGLIDSIKKRIKEIKKYIDKSFKKFARKEKIKVALDRQGVKGDGEVDTDRWALLWWNY